MSEEPKDAAVTSRSTGSGQAVSIKLVGMDQPFFVALALVISVVAALECFFTEWREERRVYFTQRCEAFVEQAVTNHQPVTMSICNTREK